MAIYTRQGSELTLLTARLVPVWIETRRGEIKWHYSEPKKTRKTIKIDLMPCWHVTAKYHDGESVFGGKLFSANALVADNGSLEVHEVLHKINPDHRDRFLDWAKGCLPATAFGEVSSKEIG